MVSFNSLLNDTLAVAVEFGPKLSTESSIREGIAASPRLGVLVILLASAIFFGTAFPPPHLMDEVDSVHAQIARNMLVSGDWVTARLNGVAYLEKSPLGYWLTAMSFRIFGVHDWAARIPLMLGVVALCWTTLSFGRWAFRPPADFYSGLVLSTCIGLFLFTRIIIPDALLTLAITIALWSFLKSLDPEESRPHLWPVVLGVALGMGLLLKGMIAVVFPIGTAIVYLTLTKQLFQSETWRRVRPFTVLLIAVIIALPWYVLATLRNPPFFDFTMRSVPGQYHGFFWFYFINEHLLRYLGLRYPHDYNTVPRLWFWLLHLVWLFPWSVYAPAVGDLNFKPVDRAGRTRLLALCWLAVVLIFFTFSTTQEYYSMPAYPAFALLIGSAMASETAWVRRGTRVLFVVLTLALVAMVAVLAQVWTLPAKGDISNALTQHPEMYTLSLGHMGDLTLQSFAYLRLPLAVAVAAVCLGMLGIYRYRRDKRQSFVTTALMMVVFFHAARLAMVVFDPYMGSKPLADALMKAPPGGLIEADAYYTFASVFFYAQRPALLWNGRVENLQYGSYAPDAPHVFIDDVVFQQL